MKVAELCTAAAALLAPREGLADPPREVRFLLARLLGRPESWLLAHGDATVDPDDKTRLFAWVTRRAAGEPAHRILGMCPFFGREFMVNHAVLVPRPETELIVSHLLRIGLPERPWILDVGTGSGCLAVTLALEIPGSTVVATDVSPGALAVAARNAAFLGASVAFVGSNLARGIDSGFDAVVANLPYLPTGSIPELIAEVRDHDPLLALDGGDDGTALVRRLLTELPRLLIPGGLALLELGADQAGSMVTAATEAGLVASGAVADVAGIERVLVLTRAANDHDGRSTARGRSARRPGR